MTGRHRQRPTRFTGVFTIGGWRLKTYEITLDGRSITTDILDAADRALVAALPELAEGVGFLVIHHGAERVWVLADLWTGDIVSQHTLSAELTAPTDLEPVPPGGPTACVWELAVHAHERNAYIDHVLDPVGGPDLDAYLSDVMPAVGNDIGDLIERFNAAWAEGDVDGLMDLMSDDPVYRASTGPEPGLEYRGRSAVRDGFATVIAAEADADPTPTNGPAGDLFCCGDRAVSTWSYTARSPAGEPTEIDGVDVWTVEHGRISRKDAYRKAFPS